MNDFLTAILQSGLLAPLPLHFHSTTIKSEPRLVSAQPGMVLMNSWTPPMRSAYIQPYDKYYELIFTRNTPLWSQKDKLSNYQAYILSFPGIFYDPGIRPGIPTFNCFSSDIPPI